MWNGENGQNLMEHLKYTVWQPFLAHEDTTDNIQ